MKNILLLFLLLPIGIFAQNLDNHYFVFLNTNPDKEVLDSVRVAELQALHLANIDRLYTEGKIVAAGPFFGGGGLFVFLESSLENVNQLLNSDPAIAANRFILEVYPFEFLGGGICPYLEPIEMISLSFIHLPKGEKDRINRRISNLQSRFEKEVISSGIFANGEGGFLVLETDVEEAKGRLLPKRGNQSVAPQIRQLYIAKGTFCRSPKK